MTQNIVTRAAVAAAAKAAEANPDLKTNGLKTALAKAIGLTPQAIQQWEAAGYIPPARIPEVATVSGLTEAELYAAYHAKKQERQAARVA